MELNHEIDNVYMDISNLIFTFRIRQLEIDRYIGLPIFLPILKHFTIIGYRF